MALTGGTRFGRFEILTPINSGGMGRLRRVVHRALVQLASGSGLAPIVTESPRSHSFSCCCPWLLVALVLFSLPTRAQEASGRVIGLVTDPAGLLVPRAKVTVTNVETGVSKNTDTGTGGSYQVLLLPVGMYRVTVEAHGFRKAVTDAKKLEINQSLKIDVRLELGSSHEVVQVEAWHQ
jgi:hypothetical protein